MKLTMLGTGNALVTECYNTCFILEENNDLFMVDGGGGNKVLKQIKDAGYDWKNIRHIFVTHKHTDHIMGIVWMMRMITQYMSQDQYDGEAWIYAHAELIDLLEDLAEKLLQKKTLKFIGDRLHMIKLDDGDTFEAIGHIFKVFDIRSTKAKQYGFVMYYGDGQKFTCCGDEPYNEANYDDVVGSDWLLHEAFCLNSEADIHHPYEKNHSTAKDACELGERLEVKNILLYHTEDTDLMHRAKRYTEEGQAVYKGNIWVPMDLEEIEII